MNRHKIKQQLIDFPASTSWETIQNSAAQFVFKATSSASSSLVTVPEWTTNCQLSVTTSSPTHLLPISLTFSLCTPLPVSFVLLRTHGHFVSPTSEQKHLASAVFPTVLQSNGIPSLLTSVTFNLPSLQNCVKNSPLQIIPQQVISNSVFLPVPLPPYYP